MDDEKPVQHSQLMTLSPVDRCLAGHWRVAVLGQCSRGPDQIRDQFLSEGPGNLSRLDGHYVLVMQNDSETYLVTSLFGTIPYFYVARNGEFFHGETVLEVARRSGLPWQWNWRALADFIQLDHVLGSETLHPQIERTPPASIIHFHAGRIEVEQLAWNQIVPPERSTPDEALEAFNADVARWTGEQTILSMSGGFDSRVILSALLKQGRKIPLVVLGSDDSSDVVVTRQIADRFHLDCTVVRVDVEDYFTQGETIAAVSNGVCSAVHWHAYLYLKNMNLGPETEVLVGSNGEFARSFYLARGYDAIRAAMSARRFRTEFWSRHLAMPFSEAELPLLTDALRGELEAEGERSRVERLVAECDAPGARGFDKFYLHQRVYNFVALGLRMLAQSAAWRTPFLGPDWVRDVWNMNRYWKIGSNWHRFAIARNYPELLDVPLGTDRRVARREAFRTWFSPPFLRRLRRLQRVSRGGRARHRPAAPPVENKYVNPGDIFRSDMAREYLCDHAGVLSDLCAPALVSKIVEEHRQSETRTPAMAWLLTMVCWINCQRERR